MTDIEQISTALKLGENGIWYSPENESVSYPSEGNDRCFAVEDHSFWFRHRNGCIVSAVRAFPPVNHGAIYDIGGGNGFVTRGIAEAGFDVALVEPGAEGCVNAKQRGIENVICATTATAGFRPGALPAVGLFDVIEHMEDDLAFLQSINALMQSGGHLYATVKGTPGHTYSYGYGQDISIGDWAKMILSIGEEKGHWEGVEVVEDEARLRPGKTDLMRLGVDYSKIKRETSWKPKYDRDHGIAETIRYYAENRDKWWGRIDW